MKHAFRRPRFNLDRHRPALERLEPRSLLSGNLPGVLSAGLDLTSAPQQVTIVFDQKDVDQLNEFLHDNFGIPSNQGFSFLLNMFDSGFDFELDQITGAGSREIFGPDNPPALEAVTSAQQGGSTETVVTIPFVDSLTADGKLAPGTYQLSVVGGTTLDLLYSQFEQDSGWTALAGADPTVKLPIAQFTYQGAGATFAAATALGTLGPNIETIGGQLQPDNFASAVQLYQFTLAPGHHWQVGVEVAAQTIGSDLLPDLTLFDAQGNVIAASNAGTGIPADQNDPYVFAGLQPGTYYVGVSGYGNPAYGATGYNPLTGMAGSPSWVQHGGPFSFQLGLVAIPHDRPTVLTSFAVNHADPAQASPTSLTLTFSGPIDLKNLFVVDQQQAALEVVDASGKVWPVTADSYSVTSATLEIAFNQPLPPGQYRLIVPSQGGLADLAGLSVVAPGAPAGVLASFIVSRSLLRSDPANLGVLWPSATDTAHGGSFSGTTALAPGQAVTYQFSTIVPGFETLQTQVQSGQVAIYLFGPSGTQVIDAADAAHLSDYLLYLDDGRYGLRFVNLGAQPAQLSWALKISTVDWEKIYNNGVGQTSALSLALYSPEGSTSAPTAGAAIGAVAASALAGSSPAQSGPIPGTLLVTLSSGLVGQPGAEALAVGPVGPAVETASVSLAEGGSGLIPGIRYTSTLSSDAEIGAALAENMLATSQAQATAGAGGAAPVSELARLDPDAQSARADERALRKSEWLARAGDFMQNVFAPAPHGESETTDLFRTYPPDAMVQAAGLASEPKRREQGRTFRPGKTDHAEIVLPTGLIVAAALAYRLRRTIPRWWKRRQPAPIWREASEKVYPRPHSSPRTIGRLSTKVRHARVRS
jgi:hypothetical protein